MSEGQTKRIAQKSSWSWQLIQQGTVAINFSLGLFVLSKFCLWFVSLREIKTSLFQFSAVLSLCAIQNRCYQNTKNAFVQCLLIKIWELMQILKRFFCGEHLHMIISLLHEQPDHCPVHTWRCIVCYSAHLCSGTTDTLPHLKCNVCFPYFGLFKKKKKNREKRKREKSAGLVRIFLQMRRNLGFNETKWQWALPTHRNSKFAFCKL